MIEKPGQTSLKRWAGIVVAPFLLLIVYACTPNLEPSLNLSTSTPAPAIATVTKPAWEGEWQKALETVKKEGRLVIYGAPLGETRLALMETFRKTYGIPVEYIGAMESLIAEKSLTERRAGIYLSDVYIGGAGSGLNILKANKAFDPLEPLLLLPEVTDTKIWWGEKLPWVDKEKFLLAFLGYVNWPFAINSELVRSEEIKSFRDVLNPKWKGKMVMSDPVFTGTGRFFFGGMGMQIMGIEYMRELAKQEPIITRDWRQQAEWVARGKYAIAVAPYPAYILEFMNAGAPIKFIIPVEGSYLTAGSGNVAFFNKAPHPGAAKVFINWLLSKEGQTLFSKTYIRQSLRVDLPTDYLDPEILRQPGVKYASTMGEDYILQEPKNNELAREIFGIR